MKGLESVIGRFGKVRGFLSLMVVVAMFLSCQDRATPTAPTMGSSETGQASSDRMTPVPVSRSRSRDPIVVGEPNGSASATPTQAGAPTHTATPGPPTATPTATRTPTPAGPTIIRLRAVRWVWQWIQGPGTTPGNPAPSITLKSGQTYQLHVFNGDIPDDVYQPHQFSGIFGWFAGATLPYNAPDYVVTIVAPAPGTYMFSCQQNDCGPTVRHEGMVGSIVVVP
jgi:hypothetical protein